MCNLAQNFPFIKEGDKFTIEFQMDNNKIRVGITQGDVNGIGYEVILKTLEDSRMLELCTPIVYGSAKIASFYRKMLNMPAVPFSQIADTSEISGDANYIINVVGEDLKVEPGEETRQGGEAAFAALERAVADLKEGKIDVLVTAPINKHNIQSDTFKFPGHTEYLQSVCDDGSKALMILASDNMRVALVTTHLPVSQVASALSSDLILEKIKSFSNSLKKDYMIVNPRIAVLSLNPHAGDEGVLGNEEKEIIIPAIEMAKAEKIQAYGPYSSDGFFGSGSFKHFDGILAMYHDQGLIPFKTLAMNDGVNFTAGLPFVRTSPDHGTAYDITGKGVADNTSMRSAIYAAIDIYRNRERYADMTHNPLRKQYFDKSKDNVVLDLTSDDKDTNY